MRATYCLLIICLLLLTLTIALAVPLLWGDDAPGAEGIDFVWAEGGTDPMQCAPLAGKHAHYQQKGIESYDKKHGTAFSAARGRTEFCMQAVNIQEERKKQYNAALHGGGGENLPADREIRTPVPAEKGVRA